MDITDFELITILASEGNITRTADRLYTSQSAISYRIKVIEKELDARLFDRGINGVTLTDEGKIVLRYAKRFVKEYDELRTALGYSANRDVIGSVRVGTSTTMTIHVMMNIVKQIQTSYPNISISVSGGNSDTITEQTKSGLLDMSVVRGDIKWDGEKILLFEEPICIVTKGGVTPEQLENSTFITHPYSNAKDYIIRFREEHERITKRTTDIENVEACLDLIKQGFGWSILPAISLSGRKGLDCYQIVWANGESATRKTWLIVNEELDLQEPKFRVFNEYARNEIPALMDKLVKQLDIKQIP